MSVDPWRFTLVSREEHNPRRTFLGRGSWTETARIAEVLRQETVGGALLLLGTVVALVWINSPAGGSYEALRDFTSVRPPSTST